MVRNLGPFIVPLTWPGIPQGHPLLRGMIGHTSLFILPQLVLLGKDLNVSWAWGEGAFSALEAKAGKLTDLKARLGNIMRCSSPPSHPKTNQKRAERKL